MKKRGVMICARTAALLSGIVFTLIGLLGGEGKAVLQKAVRVCLACIGIE